MDTSSLLWRDLGRHPTPNPAEQDELARAVEESIGLDYDKAVARMIERNMPLVAYIVKRYKRFAEMDDLIQEGAIGLQRAVVKFRRGMGAAFNTYAGPWIRQAARRYLANKSRLIRLPYGKDLSLMSGDTPAWDGYKGGAVASLDWRLAGGETTGNLVPCHRGGALEADAEAEACHRVLPLVAGLEPKSAVIVTRLWGLGGRSPETLQAIGVDLGCSREWVRQLRERALRDMRRAARDAETKGGL